jgi:hypothetical protein
MRNSGRFVFFAFAGWIITSAAQGTDRQDRNGIGSRILELTPLSEIQVQAWAAGAEDAAAIADGRLFIPLGYRGLAIYDITNPSQPVPVAHVENETLEGQGGAVAAVGNRAFVEIATQSTIAVLDISIPQQPVKLGEFASIESIQNMAIAGSSLFVQAGSSTEYPGGIYAFDLTQSPIPSFAGAYLVQLVDPGFFVLEDGTVFLARTPANSGAPAGVDVVDMAEPSTPVLLGYWPSPLPGNVTGIRFANKRLVLSAYWGGLWVVDASDYAAMVLESSFDWQAPAPYAVALEFLDPYVFLAQGGPTQAHQKFDEFLLIEEGTPSLEDEIPATGIASRVYRDGGLLIFEELHDTNGDFFFDMKKLRLYSSTDLIFTDGFESGDTSKWSRANP